MSTPSSTACPPAPVGDDLPALKDLCCRVKKAQSVLDSIGVDVYEHGTSLAETVVNLQSTRCAPSEVVIFPRKSHIAVKPHGAPKPISFYVDESWAKLFACQFAKMRAAGTDVYFDLDHKSPPTITARVKSVYWTDWGVTVFVEWTDIGRDLILRGKANSFSPTWVHSHESFPYGVKPNFGALLSVGTKPALQRMPEIRPRPQINEVKLLARRFMQFVNERLPAFQARSEFGLIECYASIASELPDLYRAHLLLKAIAAENKSETEIAYS